MTSPAVSVICSVHDGEPHLEASIRSILDQTFEDFELVAIDDGSTDATPVILEELRSEDPRIVVVQQENVGLTRSLNRGLGIARGELVARQDDDDVSLPDRLSMQVAFLGRNPRCVAVGTRYLSIDGADRIIGRGKVPLGSRSIRHSLLTHNVLAHSSVMFRRRAVLDAGGYDERYATAQDYELWCRLALDHDLGNLADVLLHRRWHEGMLGVSESAQQLHDRGRIRRRYRQAILDGKGSRNGWTLRMAARLCRLRDGD